MDAGVPTTVPITNLVKGKTKIIKIKNGIERSKLMIIFNICSIHFGIRNTLPFSPATSSTPKGSPITMAKKSCDYCNINGLPKLQGEILF